MLKRGRQNRTGNGGLNGVRKRTFGGVVKGDLRTEIIARGRKSGQAERILGGGAKDGSAESNSSDGEKGRSARRRINLTGEEKCGSKPKNGCSERFGASGASGSRAVSARSAAAKSREEGLKAGAMRGVANPRAGNSRGDRKNDGTGALARDRSATKRDRRRAAAMTGLVRGRSPAARVDLAASGQSAAEAVSATGAAA